MKKYLLIIIASVFISCSSDDDSNEPIIDLGKVYEGSVELKNPQEIEEFGANNYNTITGSLTIKELPSQEHITNIDALNSINRVEGKLSIIDNTYLTNISGLSNLSSVYSIDILNNEVLTNLDGLNNIASISGDINIENNLSLLSLEGLNSLTTVKILTIKNNNLITNLNGLENVTSINTLTISNNTSLVSLNGLEEITSILNYIWIVQNSNLSDLCSLQDLIVLPSSVFIFDNYYNPDMEQILAGFCSL